MTLNKEDWDSQNSQVDTVLDTVQNICPFCDKRFSTVDKVQNHVQCVHQRAYRCDKCKRSYNCQESLEEHKVIHRPDYFFECDTCHVKYKSDSALRRHQVRVHNVNESTYMCEHCGRNYKLKIDLMSHIKKSHSTDLQICRFCGKEVRDVKGHEWHHQKRQLTYEHACHLCSKKFRHRSRLDNHLLLHEKGFKCAECTEKYHNVKELKRHKLMKHCRANAHTCIICKKDFICISNFYQHVLTHAGIRPYKCDVCEEDFTQRSSLLRHRRIHPGPLAPLPPTNPQVAELARNVMRKFQNGQIGKTTS